MTVLTFLLLWWVVAELIQVALLVVCRHMGDRGTARRRFTEWFDQQATWVALIYFILVFPQVVRACVVPNS